MDEITLNSKTLKADNNPAATYVIDEEDANTVDDVTDVFDEESTLTPRGDEDLCDVPDLPLDSVNTTPTRSSGRSTPATVRKATPAVGAHLLSSRLFKIWILAQL